MGDKREWIKKREKRIVKKWKNRIHADTRRKGMNENELSSQRRI